MGYNTVTVGSGTPALIADANTKRQSIIITNEGPTRIYVGSNDSVTSATGIVLSSGTNYAEDNSGGRMWKGPFYAVAEDDENDVRYWEREQAL